MVNRDVKVLRANADRQACPDVRVSVVREAVRDQRAKKVFRGARGSVVSVDRQDFPGARGSEARRGSEVNPDSPDAEAKGESAVKEACRDFPDVEAREVNAASVV